MIAVNGTEEYGKKKAWHYPMATSYVVIAVVFVGFPPDIVPYYKIDGVYMRSLLYLLSLLSPVLVFAVEAYFSMRGFQRYP